MAVIPKAIRATSAAALESGINAYLSPLSGGASVRVLGVKVDSRGNEPFFLSNLYVDLATDTVGAVAQANPFQFITFSAPTEAEVESLCSAFIAANPTFFFSQVFTIYRPEEPDPTRGVILGIFYSADAANAASNWASIAPAGGGVSSVLYGNSLWVDAVNGDDATAVPGRFDKPYLTINAAVTAAVSGRVVYVRPGAYTVTAPINKNGIRVHCDIGATINYNVFLIDQQTVNEFFRLSGRARLVATGSGSRFYHLAGGVSGCTVYAEMLEHATTAANGTIALFLDATAATIDVRCERDFVYNGSSASEALIRPGNSFTSSKMTMYVGGDFQNSGSGGVVGLRQTSTVSVKANRILASSGAAIMSIGSGAGSWTVEAVDIIQGTTNAIAVSQGNTITVRAPRINATGGPAISSTSTGTIEISGARTVTGTTNVVSMSNGTVRLNSCDSMAASSGAALNVSGGTLNLSAIRTITGTSNCVALSTGTITINACDSMSASAGTALNVTGGTLSMTGVRTVTGTTTVLTLATGTVTTAGGESWTASGGIAISISSGTFNGWQMGIVQGSTDGASISGGTVVMQVTTLIGQGGSGRGLRITGGTSITVSAVTISGNGGVNITGGTTINITAFSLLGTSSSGFLSGTGSDGTITVNATIISATSTAAFNQTGGSATIICSNARIINTSGANSAAARNVATGSMIFQNCVFIAPAGAATSISATGATNIVFNTPCSANKALAGTITALVTTPTVSANVI